MASLALLPSVTFGLLEAEVFPWAFLFYCLYSRSVNKLLMLLIFCMLMSSLYVVYVNGNDVLLEVFRSFLAYINSLLIFNLIMVSSSYKVSRWVGLVNLFFWAFILWGLVQSSGILSSYDYIFKHIIPRGYSYSLSFMGDRGVTLMASEPARAGIELIFIYLVVRFVTIPRKYILILDVVVLIFLAIVIKSAISLIFFVVCLAIFYRFKAFIFFGIVLAFSPFVVGTGDLISSRAINLFVDLYHLNTFESMFNTLINTGGHRVISIYSSYAYGFLNPFGGGIGNWQTSSVDSLMLTGIDPSNIQFFKVHGGGEAVGFRSSGFIANFMLDLGVAGFILLFVYLYRQIKSYWKFDYANKALIFIFMLKILFIGSVGNPVSWICFAVAIRARSINKYEC